MNEYVFVEFIAGEPLESARLKDELGKLGKDFMQVNFQNENEEDEDGNYYEWVRIQGKISSQYASVIKLQNTFLAERMRISYIPNDLKDKYRR